MAKQGEHGISWTEHTWNPARGCSMAKGSETGGCLNCYAAAVACRFNGPGQPYEGLARRTRSGPRWTGELRMVEDHLLDPLRWQKPRRVFVNSMSDLFHEALSDEEILAVFAVMAMSPKHQFQVLTKRPERMRELLCRNLGFQVMKACLFEVLRDDAELTRQATEAYIRRSVVHDPPLPNVWLGVSAENRQTLWRIDELRVVPAAVRFVSLEPLLSALGALDLRGIHWVIVGGESGPGARPMHPDWARQARDQCVSAGVAFHFKQWGGYAPTVRGEDTRSAFSAVHGVEMRRVGKRAAGRLLDGRTWDEYPEVGA